MHPSKAAALALGALALSAAANPARAEDRVALARRSKSAAIAALFQAATVAYPPGEVYLRAFKSEGELELWAGPAGRPLTLLKTYPICKASGVLGPKRQQGDLQVPEGFYRIVDFNPNSTYHLSLGLDYPNASDRILGVAGKLGQDIYIHGECFTIGCIPLQNDSIEEVFLISQDARDHRQKEIPVHIFPRRMDDAGMAFLAAQPDAGSALLEFWGGLRPGYLLFETSKRPPKTSVDPRSGRYRFER